MLERLEDRLAVVLRAGKKQNALFGLLQLTVAQPNQRDAFFVAGQRIVQAELTVLQIANHAFQISERFLETAVGGSRFTHDYFPFLDRGCLRFRHG